MGHTEQLARQLQMLKARTDRSYEALARRVGVSRSTLHRYCRGEVVPGLDVVVRFARVCGATKQEAEDLVRYWALAADQRPLPPARWWLVTAALAAGVCAAVWPRWRRAAPPRP
jgi:transcriptional regulator with XRE-family HTH domain